MGEDKKGNYLSERYLFAQQSVYDPKTWEVSYQFQKWKIPVFFPI